MPALLVNTSPSSASPSQSSSSSHRPEQHHPRSRSRSTSPDRPPVSPLTPTVAAAQLAQPAPSDPRTRVVPPPPPPAAPAATTFIQQPPSVPISESENPDAIALRSAISLLQMQREKSKRDLKALQDLKAAAVADPHGFARSLQEQSAQAARRQSDILTPTLSDIADMAAREGEDGRKGENGLSRQDSAAGTETSPKASAFPAIPQPQNIIRCPPVNWAKYNIVGEPLDKLHEEQKRYPGAAEPPRTKSGARAPPHQIAAPYSPFTDGISGPPSAAQPSKGLKKSPSQGGH